jgi:hypothetical protein
MPAAGFGKDIVEEEEETGGWGMIRTKGVGRGY